jgi:peptidyl-prolyl cis-trans isomerase D
MPVMTKMRDSMPVVFAGLAAVFLLMIIFEWGGQGMIFNKTGDAETLGIVNGRKITRKDYDRIYQAVLDQMKNEAKGAPLTEAQEDQAGDRAWDQALSESIIDASIDRMGITVTDQDVRDAVFENPPAEVRKQFTDSTGQYHQDWYIKALRDPRNDTLVRQMEAGVRDQLRKMKWQEAIVAAMRVDDEDVKDRYMVDSAKAEVQIVRLLAPTPSPQDISTVTPQELQAYYDKHKYQYKQPESRKFKFVVFRLMPNARDTAQTIETGKSVAAKLKEAPVEKLDTVAHELVADYGDLKSPAAGNPRGIITMREIGTDTSIFSAKPGDAIVTHVSGKLAAVRVMGIIDSARPLVHYRQIIFRTLGQDVKASDSTKAAAEQVMQRLKSGTDFASMARQYSADPRGAVTGGDMGWAELFGIPPEAQSEIMASAPGSLHGPIKSAAGFTIIQMLGVSRRVWEVVQVPLSVKPSHQTLQIQQQMANIFHENAVKQGFDEAAKAAAYNVEKNAPPAQKKGTPIFNSHAFIDWIFQASKNDISPVMKMTQQNFYLVAQLTEITPEGPSPLEDVKERIAPEVAKKKVVDALQPRAQQVKNAIGSGDMDAAARAMNDSTLRPATFLMGPAESVNGLPSMEYGINNWAYSANNGDVSPLIKGDGGWYVAKLISRHIPSDQDFQFAKASVRQRLFQEREQRFMMDWIQNQKDNASIVDYRVHR